MGTQLRVHVFSAKRTVALRSRQSPQEQARPTSFISSVVSRQGREADWIGGCHQHRTRRGRHRPNRSACSPHETGRRALLGPRAGTASAVIRAGARSLVGQRPGMLFNSLRCTGWPSRQRTTQPEVSWCSKPCSAAARQQSISPLPASSLWSEQTGVVRGWGENHDHLSWTVI